MEYHCTFEVQSVSSMGDNGMSDCAGFQVDPRLEVGANRQSKCRGLLASCGNYEPTPSRKSGVFSTGMACPPCPFSKINKQDPV
jgi:hypothetical protein